MKIRRKLEKKRPAFPPREPLPKPPSRLARQLALAYKIERMIDAGELRDYADAAGHLGITGARVTQVVCMRYLPVATQEAILMGDLITSERQVRSEHSVMLPKD